MESSRVLSDRYALISHLARGGMADVWIAEDRVLGRQVAVKILHTQFAESEAFVQRFRRESQSAANLSHANIVAVHDWGQDGDTYFMVMELIQGRNLRDVIRSEGALLPRRVAEIGAEVGVALSVAHNQGLVHRDIKPANVLLAPDGSVKVADFGIARAWDDSEQLTKTGAVIGTATYFSPEQAQGHTADGRSDIYSLGVVMYELLTGQPPFSGESPVAVAYQHVQEPPQPPSRLNANVPPGLEAIVLKAMAKHPDDRYQTAAEMVEDIDRLLAGQVPLAAPQNEAPTRVMARPSGLPPVPSSRTDNPFDTPPPGYRDAVYAEPGSLDRSTMTIGIIAATALLVLGVILLIRLLGSGGASGLQEIPDLRGTQPTDAITTLENLGFAVEQETVADDEMTPGLVAGTDPAAGTELETGSTVTILVSGGPANVEVPNVVGLTEAQARQAIESAGLEVGEIVLEPSPLVEAGIVLGQSPAAGDLTSSGADVDLIVSAGADALLVPNVVGKTEGDALFTLSQGGFQADQIRVERQPSADVLEGFVIETSPAAGGAVPLGGFVTMIVSEGAVPSVVPSVITRQPADASSLLEGLGFVVIFDDPIEVPFDDPLVGVVAEQDPPAGATADFGSTIRLRVGRAPESAEVPNLVGSDEVTARDALAALGLVFQRGTDIALPIGDPGDGKAIEQSQPPGAVVDVGTTVSVRFGVAAQPATVPDLVGNGTPPSCLTPSEAEAAISAADLVGSRGPDLAVAFGNPCAGRVVSQTPDPLEVVASGSTVTYRVGVAPGGVTLTEASIIGQTVADVQTAFPTLTWTANLPQSRCQTSNTALHDKVAKIDPAPNTTVATGSTVTYWLGHPSIGQPCA